MAWPKNRVINLDFGGDPDSFSEIGLKDLCIITGFIHQLATPVFAEGCASSSLV